MPRPKNPEVEKLIAEGMMPDAARKTVQRRRLEGHVEGQSSVVGHPKADVEGQVSVENVPLTVVGQRLVGQMDVEGQVETVVDVPLKGKAAKSDSWEVMPGVPYEPHPDMTSDGPFLAPRVCKYMVHKDVHKEYPQRDGEPVAEWIGRLLAVGFAWPKGLPEDVGIDLQKWREVYAKHNRGRKVTEGEAGAAPVFTLLEPDSRFFTDKKFAGHGVPVDGKGGRMCLVNCGQDEAGQDLERMVSEEEFIARLEYQCPHGFSGWTCKACIMGREKPVQPNEYAEVAEERLTELYGERKAGGEVWTDRNGRAFPVYRRGKDKAA